MVICKFFLQGNCRFGDSCKFEHQLNENKTYNSILRQQNFAPATNTTNVDTQTLIRAVINDMLSTEKGGQWLLSVYAPFKEKPNFPGFQDQSFEEIRWGYYEAQRSGLVNQYIQQLQMALQSIIINVRALQNPMQEAIETIKTIYHSPANITQSTFSNANVNQQSSNTFGQNNFGNSNVFVQQQSAGPKSIFAAANEQLFGNSQPQSNTVFGTNQNTFSNNFTTTPSATFNQPFGVPQQAQPLQPNTSIFQTANTTPQPSPFVKPQSNSSSIFSQPIGSQPPISNLSPFTSSNAFGGNSNSSFSQSSTGNTVLLNPNFKNIDEKAYSKLDELSENDKKSYESESFEFGKIPEKPPTVEMCL